MAFSLTEQLKNCIFKAVWADDSLKLIASFTVMPLAYVLDLLAWPFVELLATMQDIAESKLTKKQVIMMEHHKERLPADGKNITMKNGEWVSDKNDTTPTQRKIDVMKAYEDGKTIWYRPRYSSASRWVKHTGGEPVWNWQTYIYVTEFREGK